MTQDKLKQDLTYYGEQLVTCENQIRQMREQIVQMTANANAIRGVVQYLAQQQEPETASGSNTDQHVDHISSTPVDRNDGAVLD